jgi:tRNA pseudouridine65 synthase
VLYDRLMLRILHRDEHLVAVDKPAGFHVHPPEDGLHRIARSRNCLFLLREQLGQYLYPVHRLDAATSGVLLFALSSDAAARIQELFVSGRICKTYIAVVRGWTDVQGTIDYAIAEEPRTARQHAVTDFQTVAKVELPWAIGRYATARYSIVDVQPRTGRMHQIRKHFRHLAHPLLGDTMYGDGRHNRYLRERITGSGLYLKAYALAFRHPFTGEAIRLLSRWNDPWHRVFDLFGVCPWFPPGP